MQNLTPKIALGLLLLGLLAPLLLGSVLGQQTSRQPTPAQEPSEKQRLLDDLQNQYLASQISSGEYQRRRAEVLNRPSKPGDPWDRASVRSSNPSPSSLAAPARIAASPGAGAPGQPAVSAPAALSSSIAQTSQLDAGIVPGADIVIRIDLKGIHQAPIYKALKKLEDKNASSPGTADAFPGANWIATRNLFEKTLGLSENDIEAVVISADLDKAQLSPEGFSAAAMKSVRGAAAIQLSKDITTAQIKQAILAAAPANLEGIKMTDSKIGSADVLALTPSNEDEPPLHVTVLGGRTLLAGLNRSSLTEALSRVGKAAPLQSGLAAGQSGLSQGSQIQVGFVIPQSLRDTLKGLGEMAQNPDSKGATGVGGSPGALLGGLKDIQAINLGLAFDKALTLQLVADLGQNQTAAGLNMLLQMLKPQVLSSVAEKSGKSLQEMPPDLLTSQVTGSKLRLSLKLDQAILEGAASK